MTSTMKTHARPTDRISMLVTCKGKTRVGGTERSWDEANMESSHTRTLKKKDIKVRIIKFTNRS